MSTITLVAAMTEARVIGANNRLPWRLPADLAYFKAVTIGKPVVMGRHTFESIGRALPGRDNWIVSRTLSHAPESTHLAHDLASALAALADASEIMIIGGGQLYQTALPLAQKMLLTVIETNIPGDTYFPLWSNEHWQLDTETIREADVENPHRLRFQTWSAHD